MSTEQCYLQQFYELVTGHLLCGTVFDTDLLLFDAISDEKMLHVNVMGSLST